MNRKYFYWIAIAVFIMGCKPKEENTKVKLMTLDPGHFHAALIQKLPIRTLTQPLTSTPLMGQRSEIF